MHNLEDRCGSRRVERRSEIRVLVAWVLSAAGVVAGGSSGCSGRDDKPAAPSSAVIAPPLATAASGIDGPDGLYDMPTTLDWKDTSPGWAQPGPKILLTGVIYQPDGTTPAPGIVMYYYHTDTDGRYRHRPGEPRSMPPNEQGQTHGSIRGWIKTGVDGRYAIYTVRPGAYPGESEPEHVHVTIKEPGIPEYYIDDFVFDDDPLLTERKRGRMKDRCGSGIVKLVPKDDLLVGERDIVLGRNIPGHPSGVADR